MTVQNKQSATVYYHGQPIEVVVEHNIRARRVRLKVGRSSRQAVLVLPRAVPVRKGLEFAQRKADWIMEQLALLPEEKVFQDGMTFSFLGCESVIHHSPSAKRGVWFEQNVIWVSGQSEHLARRVRDFIKKTRNQIFI